MPPVPAFGSEFNDLIQKLLLKDPLQRITWAEIYAHPWWESAEPSYPFEKFSFPEQP